MNIGLIAFDRESKTARFEHIRRWKRLEKFDDEVDIAMLKLILKGIEQNTKVSLYNNLDNFSL